MAEMSLHLIKAEKQERDETQESSSTTTKFALHTRLIQNLKQTKVHLTICLSLCFAILGMFISSLGPALLFVQKNTNATMGQIAFLTTSRSVGYFIGTTLGGPIFDKMNGNRVLSLSILLAVIGNGMIPLAKSVIVVNGAVAAVGFAMGILDTGGNVSLVWLHGDKAGPFLQVVHLSFGIGAFLSPILIGIVMDKMGGNPTLAFWILSGLSVPLAVWLFFYRRVQGHSDRAKESRIGKSELGVIILSAFLLFVVLGVEISSGTYLYSFGVKTGLASETGSAFLSSLFWIGLTCATICAIPLATRLKPSQQLAFNLVGLTITVSIWAVFHTFHFFQKQFLWIGAFASGFFMGSSFPVVLNLAESYVVLTGKITTVIVIGATIGEMGVPLAAGNLFDIFGPNSFLWVLLLCSGFGLSFLTLLVFVGKHTKKMLTGVERMESDVTLPVSGSTEELVTIADGDDLD